MKTLEVSTRSGAGLDARLGLLEAKRNEAGAAPSRKGS